MGGDVYTNKEISDFIDRGIISSSQDIEKKQIQPSSLDLRCGFGKKIWHMPYSSIPKGSLIDFLDSRSTHSFILNENRFLHKKTVYIIELEEELNLPEGISSRSNPKSTTGRLDIHARLLTEEGQTFDSINENYQGKLFLEVISNSFDLFIPPGYSFNQLRFYKEDKALDQGRLEYLARAETLITDLEDKPLSPEKYSNIIDNGAMFLTLDLDLKDPGYKARNDAPVLNLSSNTKSLPASKYFEKVILNEEGLLIIPDSFYILGSKEIPKIPEDHCAEMPEIQTQLGEFRSHYAGYFDPLFNSRAVMEVRNTGNTPFLFTEGQKISSLVFYSLTRKPSISYGKEAGSNYQGKKIISLAKFFDEFK